MPLHNDKIFTQGISHKKKCAQEFNIYEGQYFKALKGLVYKNDKTLQNPETWGEKEMFRASSTSCFQMTHPIFPHNQNLGQPITGHKSDKN